jgi:uncharacterized protein YecE (DUF72 family)
MATFHIGTSGWSYDHWEGVLYPPELAPEHRLAHYAERLASVEIDSSFYRLPSEETVVRWRDAVPPGFIFAVKASRFITHMKKLNDPAQTLPPLIERVDRLGDRLGPVLFQLPPRWHRNVDRLGEFLAALDDTRRWVFELRDRSWIDDAVLALLEAHNAAFCIYDLNEFLTPLAVTADFVYVRLHGPDGAYRGSYSDAALTHWAEHIACWLDRKLDVYCYFDNDQAGHAVRNALDLQRRVAARLSG